MNTSVNIDVKDASHEEKGFFRTTAAWMSDGNRKTLYTAHGYGRGKERSISYALEALAKTLREAFPEYPVEGEAS